MPRGTSADWSAIRAEYIAGGISLRKLAEKHGVSFNTLKYRAKVERWKGDADTVYHKVTTQLPQKIVVNVVKNAADLAAKKDEFARELVDGALDTLRAYKEAGRLTPQNLKFLSGFLKDVTAKDQPPKDEGTENGTLAAALAAAVDDSEVWNDASEDVPV